jgi:dCMP deaminase
MFDTKTGKYVENAMPCAMCKRFIINSGIKKLVFRDTKTKYREIDVQELIDNDDSLNGSKGY